MVGVVPSVFLSFSQAVLPSDLTHGASPAHPSAWIDLPVFWINVDHSAARAAAMRTQLSHALLPGAVATRVPAVLLNDIATTVSGELLFSPTNTSKLRFDGPSTHRLEIAVMASHLKAILWGSKLGTAREDAFLVLEDDVDLLFFPRVRRLQTEWPTAKLSLDGLRRSLPDDWSFAQLFATSFPTRWRDLWFAWREDGRPTAIQAERVTYNRERGCPNRFHSAGAYLVRGNTAAEVLSTWPAHETPKGAFRLFVNRTCFAFRSITAQGCRMEDKWRHELDLFPRFVSDTCLLHMESFGPALTADEALRIDAALRGDRLTAGGHRMTTDQYLALRAPEK
jgi:hypothetical protein